MSLYQFSLKMYQLSDSFIFNDKLFHSCIVSHLINGTKSGGFCQSLYVSILCGIRLQICLKYGSGSDLIII